MLARHSTPAMKTGRMSAATVGMLLCASAYITPAAGASSADALPSGTPLYASIREARGASAAAQRTADSDEIRRRTDDPTRISFDAEAAQSAGLTVGATARVRGWAPALAAQYRPVAGSASDLSAPIDASLSDLLARFHSAFGSDLGFSSDRARQGGDREALLRNSDAFVRAKVRLTLGEEWLGFVYADLGAVDSALKWQGLAGIRCGHGVDLLGGWRHVTYHFSPGSGFDSLDFNGPFVGATLAW